MKTKICSKCGRELPLTSEYFHRNRSDSSGFRPDCKICRHANLKKYGITAVQWDEMYNKQEGKCKICGRHQSEFTRRLHTHHDHKTDEVKCLLCVNCNTTIGRLKDNPYILIKIIKLLEKGEL